MKQTVSFEKPNTLMLKLKGEWLPEEALDLYNNLDQLIEGVGTIKSIIDVTELKNIPPKTREIASQRSRNLSVSKMAIIGASARVRMLGSLMLKMIPQIKKAKFFDTEAKARAWLAEEK